MFFYTLCEQDKCEILLCSLVLVFTRGFGLMGESPAARTSTSPPQSSHTAPRGAPLRRLSRTSRSAAEFAVIRYGKACRLWGKIRFKMVESVEECSKVG